MSKLLYCWRCKREVAVLEDAEWERVAPHLANPIAQIKAYRQQHGVSLAEARIHGYGKEALRIYEEITGYQEQYPDPIWHHRANLFGPPCTACGKPLRSPKAKHCAECGAERQSG